MDGWMDGWTDRQTDSFLCLPGLFEDATLNVCHSG